MPNRFGLVQAYSDIFGHAAKARTLFPLSALRPTVRTLKGKNREHLAIYSVFWHRKNNLFHAEKVSMNKSQNDGSLFVFIGALFFSGSGTIQALAPSEATPFVMGALRLLTAGIVLMLFSFVQKKLLLPKNFSMTKFILSAAALAGYQLTFFLGVLDAGVAVGTVVAIAMVPISAALLGLVLYRECPSAKWYASTAIAIAGLALINFQGGGNTEDFSLKTMIFPVCAGFIYAFYLSQSKELVQKNSPITVMTWAFLASSVLLLPIWFFFPFRWIFTLHGTAVALGIGIVTTALPYCLVMAGLRTCNTAKAATLSLAEPLGAAVLGFAVLKEPLSVQGFFGVAAIFFSVILLIYSPKKQNEKN